MSYLTKPSPEILRQMDDLGALGNPQDAPEWLTPKYIAECMENAEVQKRWKPKVGDWYICTDLFKVMKIESLEKYQSVGQASLPSDSPIGSMANGGCDAYIPDPKDLEKLLE